MYYTVTLVLNEFSVRTEVAVPAAVTRIALRARIPGRLSPRSLATKNCTIEPAHRSRTGHPAPMTTGDFIAQDEHERQRRHQDQDQRHVADHIFCLDLPIFGNTGEFLY